MVIPASLFFYHASLRVRLIFLVFLCVLPALGLTLYTNLEERRREMAQVREDILELTQTVATREEQLIEGTRQLLIVAQLPQVRDGNRALCSDFGDILKLPVPRQLGSGGSGWRCVLQRCSLKAVNLADRAWFQRVVNNRNFTVSNYQIDRVSGKPGVAFSYPVFDAKKYSQWFTLLDLAWFNQLAAEVQLPPGNAPRD